MREKGLWTPNYHSTLAPWMRRFIAEKRAGGYRYETGAFYLHQFDDFLKEQNYRISALSKDIVEAWTARRKSECSRTQVARVQALQQFAKFLIRNEVPAYLFPKCSLPVVRDTFMPYIFTHEQMGDIFAVLDRMTPDRRSPRRHIIMPVIFRVLYGCGLRVREALKLHVRDVDLFNGVLIIRDTKFGKDRLVPMASSLTQRLQCYAELIGVRDDDVHFFQAPDGGRYHQFTIYSLFRTILTQLGFVRECKRPGIRVHDLRHTMAITCLKRWYQEGACLNAKLPVLSTYLGHRKIEATQRYLKWLPAIFPEIAVTMESMTGSVIPRRRDK